MQPGFTMRPGFTLAPRDPFADAKETLSSWDNCMAKDYCKWPVIVAIIVGGIVAFSVVFCIARCLCCGAECALCCCKCCTCCCGRDSGHKRIESANQGYPPPPYPQQPYAPAQQPYAEARSFAPPPPPPQISTQYQSHPPPAIARQPSNPHFNPQTNPAFVRPASPEQPQYATFDAHSKPVNEDALPEMPSWNSARSVRVAVEDDAVVPEKRGDVELARLNHNGSNSPVNDAYAYHDQGAYAQSQTQSQTHTYNAPPTGYAPRGPSPAQSYSQYSSASDPYDQQPYTQPYANLAAQNPYDNPPQLPYHSSSSPAPPSYHTTANPYPSYPASSSPGYYPPTTANPPFDPVPRADSATPRAYPGQPTYQAFSPQGVNEHVR